MNWLPSLSAWPFAVAGLVGAAAALLIHLLNRRRHRVIAWSAMEFLREAARRKRRFLRVRDLVLLTLRCLAVLLFGLALARPHFSNSETVTALQPVHAIVVLDNSLSMTYETLEGTLLERAKQAAASFVQQLPQDSQITILPACPTQSEELLQPTTSTAAAQSAVDRIAVADQPASLHPLSAQLARAARFAEELPKQIAVLTDLQAITWNQLPAEELDALPEMHVVDFAPERRDNTWIESIRLQSGFAVRHATSMIVVDIRRCDGFAPRDVEVTLRVNERPLASRTITLAEGSSSRQVSFSHVFDELSEEASELNLVPLTVSLTEDRLPRDDTANSVVPVFSTWPILFADQFGPKEEAPRSGRLGETRALRRMLRSAATASTTALPLPHLRYADLTSEELANVSVVVVAGIADPSPHVGLLRRFVEAGGRLFIAAGGNFDSGAWNQSAWLRGDGILPLPLKDSFVGATPQESTGELHPLRIDSNSLTDHPYFTLPGNSTEQLQALYNEPFFFKAVAIDEKAAFTSEHEPRVLARMRGDDRTPLLVSRRIGRGQAALLTTGITSDWNTLAKTNGIALLDHMLRTMIAESLAEREVTNDASARIATLDAPVDPARQESDLTRADAASLDELAKIASVQLLPAAGEVQLAGMPRVSRQLWWWLVAVVLLILLVEMFVLALPGSLRSNASRVTSPAPKWKAREAAVP